jgi:hypothetical protein
VGNPISEEQMKEITEHPPSKLVTVYSVEDEENAGNQHRDTKNIVEERGTSFKDNAQRNDTIGSDMLGTTSPNFNNRDTRISTEHEWERTTRK